MRNRPRDKGALVISLFRILFGARYRARRDEFTALLMADLGIKY